MDRAQRGWAMGSLAITLLALAIYVPYASLAPGGPRGGSAIGLLFGVVGFAFMIYAAALGARKRVPTWRLGRAKAWMRGHLWLGLLSLPMILLHAGFHFGGTLTRVLIWLLIITVASGVYGALLQAWIPKKMTADVPLETIYDEISNVRGSLCEEADRAMEALCGDLGFLRSSNRDGLRAGGFTALRPIAASAVSLRTSAAVSAGASAAVAPATEIVLLGLEESAPLRAFYADEMRPFLAEARGRRQRLADAGQACNLFAGLRTVLPVAAHPLVADLEAICDESRQLRRQEWLHRWLHGWLLLHIPLSLALILLGAVHALVALRW